ncbi:MAG: helix-turn-helix transcriptional regulator [Actinomycetota bacterium]
MSKSFARRLLDEMRDSGTSEERDAYWDSEFRAELVRVLRDARVHANISQEQVAKIMGTSQSHVSEIEGLVIDPQLSTFQRYARAIDAEICLLDVRRSDGHVKRVNPREKHRTESTSAHAIYTTSDHLLAGQTTAGGARFAEVVGG